MHHQCVALHAPSVRSSTRQNNRAEIKVLVESFHRLAAELFWSSAVDLANDHFVGNLVVGIVRVQSSVLHAGVAEQYYELHRRRLVDFLFATVTATSTVTEWRCDDMIDDLHWKTNRQAASLI